MKCRTRSQVASGGWFGGVEVLGIELFVPLRLMRAAVRHARYRPPVRVSDEISHKENWSAKLDPPSNFYSFLSARHLFRLYHFCNSS